MPGILSAPILAAISDSGRSATDNVTKVAAPVLFGAGATADATVHLRDSDGITILGTAVAAANGTWTIYSSTLADGVHTLTAAEVGLGGAIVNTSAALAVTIDTVAPAAPLIPTIAASSDTGVSPTDGITNDNTPTVTGIGVELGAIVDLYYSYALYQQIGAQHICSPAPFSFCFTVPTYGYKTYYSPLASKTADTSGNWSITTDPLPEFEDPFVSARWLVAKQTDRAGNVSDYGQTTGITVDTQAPGAPTSAALDLSADPRRLNVVIAGTASVLLFEGDNLVGKAGELLDVSSLATGQHSISAKGIDYANPDGPLVPVLLITRGTSGNDDIIGTAGLDLLSGGAGDDQYTIDDATDGVTEQPGGGNDRIVTSVSYKLAFESHVETLAATLGAGNLTLTGNDYANTIEGGDGDDTLAGGLGDDTLRGGAGHNVAVFPGFSSEYVISPAAGATTVSRAGETDTLTDIRTLKFGNGIFAAAVDGPWWYAIRSDNSGLFDGNGQPSQAKFTVDRFGDTSLPSSVAWATCTCAIPDYFEPVDGSDFIGGTMPFGILAFAAGETSRTFTIDIAGDSQLESDEAYRVKLLASPGGAPLANASVIGPTILNDDALLLLTAAGAGGSEGTGGTSSFTFSVFRGANMSHALTVDWSVAGLTGSGTLPADANDFASGVLPSGTVGFAPGESSQYITINVAADTTGEANERFRVTLSNPSAGTTIGTATANALILNDDTSFGAIATTSTQTEGHAATRTYSFVVQRTGTTTTATNDVSWSIAGTGPTPATPSDFVGSILPAGTLSFTPGQASQKVTIAITGDTTIEPDEHFKLTLAAPTNGATLHQPTATATIQNDDASLSITSLSANKPEGTGTTTPFTFTITRTGDVSKNPHRQMVRRRHHRHRHPAHRCQGLPRWRAPRRHRHLQPQRNHQAAHRQHRRRPNRRTQRTLRRHPHSPQSRRHNRHRHRRRGDPERRHQPGHHPHRH